MRVILYDDFNCLYPPQQNIVGTITIQYGNKALRHGSKLIITTETI